MARMQSGNELESIAREYIATTHGSLPEINRTNIESLLSEDFELSNEEQRHTKSEICDVFSGWASIVEGHSSITIHAVSGQKSADHAESGVVLAHWETNYDCKDGSIWYGTDIDISKKRVRGFQVFAKFTIENGLITRIIQRSDTVVKHLGIEDAVRAYKSRSSS